jgi:hypothetical protein
MFFTAFALCLVVGTMAQTSTKAPKNLKWKNGGIVSLMGGQTGTRNWTAAPEKFSLSGVGTMFLFANKTWTKNTWENNLELAYGLSNTTSGGLRKLDDKIDLYTRYGYWFKPKMGFGVLGNLRTQFSNGWDYSETPKKRISGFFAPAYLTLGAALHFKPVTDWTISVGPAVRWNIVTNNPYSLRYQGGIKPDGTQERTLADIYNIDPVEKTRQDAGFLLSTTFNRKIAKNVMYRTRLDALVDVNNNTNGATDVYWTNTFTMSVNKWLKVNYNYDLVHDKDVKYFGDNKNESALQMKSILGVGLAVGF